MNMHKYMAVLLALPFFASCEKEIKVKVPEYKPLLVVNSDTKVGDTITLSVGTSVSILKYKYNQDLSINNANVSLYSGNALLEEMKYDKNSRTYVSNTIANPGQQYTIKVNAQGHAEAQSTTNVPSKVTIANIQRVAKARLDENGQEQDELRITFTDPPSAGDYYILSLINNDSSNSGNNYEYTTCVNTVDASVETINNEDIGLNTCLDNNAIFLRDALFNGSTKELRLFVNSYFFEGYPGSREPVGKVKVILKHVTEDYFKFKKTYQFASDNAENPFSEPTNVYTNVKNGYGIFSVMSSDEAEVK